MVELASGIDAFYLSAQGTAPPSLFADLEVARSAAEATGLPVDFDLCGYTVKVQSSTWGRYRYCARHELGRLGFTPSNHLPVVRIQPTAVALHALGPAGTALWATNLLDACDIAASLHLSRIDLFSDWHGLDLRASDRRNFVTYSDLVTTHEVDTALSGLSFGKRGANLFARIYDKSRQANDKGHDWWPTVWGAAYDPARQVQRVEFEFRRAGLKQFGVDTPQQGLDLAPALWAYATCQWLSLRVPTADETRSRWPLDRRWERVQPTKLRNNCVPAQCIREGERQGELRTFRKLATGMLSSVAVPLGTVDLADTL